jgi:hypothetical protein
MNIIQGALEQFLLNPYTKLYPVWSWCKTMLIC